METMKRVGEVSSLMGWFNDRPGHEAMTGYDAAGWPASTWILHAMYENAAISGIGTHDDLYRRRLEAGDIAPFRIGSIDVAEDCTVMGVPLGFVSRPDSRWVRVTWAEYLQRFPDFQPDREVPPCFRWFPHASWPAALRPPPSGSLDQESSEALIDVLAAHSPEGEATPCLAFYAALPTGDFDSTHLWQGTLGRIPDLFAENGGEYEFSPTNFWPLQRQWFAWTDYDLMATKVSGQPVLVNALQAEPRLECLNWTEE